MANGTRIPIKDVKVGDQVLATDPETGESGPREVVATLPHTDQLLTLRTSSGEVVTTEDHRYWNETDQAWQESQHLDAGDRLLTADGDEVLVEGLDWTTVHTADAYDLTIADLHTFYVAAGDDDEVLVHNCGVDDLLGAAADFDADELAQLAYQHIGAGDIAGRPTLNQISAALATNGERIAGQNAVRFTLDDVVVIINEDMPTRSTAFFRGS